MWLQWISRLVIVLVVTVVLSEAILIPNDRNAAEVCEELRMGERKILALGARKNKSTEDANFYVLASGGYLYTLSLSNLVIDEQKKRNFSMTIDQVYIDASKLFRLSESDFYLEKGTFNNRFFFISNYYGWGFLGRMLQNSSSTHVQLHWLNGNNARRVQMNKVSQDIPFLASWRTDGDEVWGYQVQSVANGVNVAWKYTFRFQIKSNNQQLEQIGPHGRDNVILRLQENVQIYTGFYIELNGYTYFFVLYNDRVTITKTSNDKIVSGEENYLKMEIKLSEFIVCQYAQTPASKTSTKTSSTTETISTENDDPLKWYFILVTVVVWAIVLLVLLYCCGTCCRSKNNHNKKKDNLKRKKLNQDLGSSNQSSDTGSSWTNSNQSSNQSDQNASSAPPSTIQKISNSTATRQAKSPRKSKSAISKITKTLKSKLSGILSVNKSKAAKSVNKANRSKKEKNKSKVSKGSKAGNAKDGKLKNDGPKDGGPKPD